MTEIKDSLHNEGFTIQFQVQSNDLVYMTLSDVIKFGPPFGKMSLYSIFAKTGPFENANNTL